MFFETVESSQIVKMYISLGVSLSLLRKFISFVLVFLTTYNTPVLYLRVILLQLIYV